MSWCVVRAASWLSGVRDATLPGRLRRMRRKTAAIPAAHEHVSFASALAKFCSKGPFRWAAATTLWGVALRRPVPGRRVGQRRAGRCGGWVGARSARFFVGTHSVRSRFCPCYHA